MQMIRQDDRRNRLERPLVLRIPPRCPQIFYSIDKDSLTPVLYGDGEKIRSAWNEEATVIGHPRILPVTALAVKNDGGYPPACAGVQPTLRFCLRHRRFAA